MGLDQVAYIRYPGAPIEQTYEIAYWRKHPNLHGWMEKLYHKKYSSTSEFNGEEMQLTSTDLDKLEEDIKNNNLSKLNTTGFFFGPPADEYYLEKDLEFIRKARIEICFGFKIFYNSSW